MLNELKKRHNLSNEVLAVLLNIPADWIAEIMNGQRKLHKNKLKELKKSLKGIENEPEQNLHKVDSQTPEE